MEVSIKFMVPSKFWSCYGVDACVGAALICPPIGFLICSISKSFVILDRVGDAEYTDYHIISDNYAVDVLLIL